MLFPTTQKPHFILTELRTEEDLAEAPLPDEATSLREGPRVEVVCAAAQRVVAELVRLPWRTVKCMSVTLEICADPGSFSCCVLGACF